MKIVFFGTPIFAAKVLGYLLDHQVDVAAVVTQPDRPKGRSLQLTPSPVKILASERRLLVLQPEKASQEPFLQQLTALQADLFVVVAFGQILSQRLLDLPPKGCINVHASLLPKYRGAAPMQRCLMAGDTTTGIAIQKMVRKLDAGDVLASASMSIPLDMTCGELEEGLIALTQPLLLKVIRSLPEQGEPQDESQVTYAPKIELEEGEIHWNRPAAEIHNLIRAFSPRPGAWCSVSTGGDKKRLKILRSRPVSSGRLADGIIACGEGFLQLIEVQPEGKKIMPASDWLRGQKDFSF